MLARKVILWVQTNDFLLFALFFFFHLFIWILFFLLSYLHSGSSLIISTAAWQFYIKEDFVRDLSLEFRHVLQTILCSHIINEIGIYEMEVKEVWANSPRSKSKVQAWPKPR